MVDACGAGVDLNSTIATSVASMMPLFTTVAFSHAMDSPSVYRPTPPCGKWSEEYPVTRLPVMMLLVQGTPSNEPRACRLVQPWLLEIFESATVVPVPPHNWMF